jgi:hypothetical protein
MRWDGGEAKGLLSRDSTKEIGRGDIHKKRAMQNAAAATRAIGCFARGQPAKICRRQKLFEAKR